MSGAPCRGCGCATTGPTFTKPGPGGVLYELGTCAACLALDFDRPGAGVRAALRVLDKNEADDHLAAGVFEEAGLDVSWLLYENGRGALAQDRPWGHVTREHRAALRKAYVGVLDARVHAATRKDLSMPLGPPPSGPAGCLACGVGESSGWGSVRTAVLTRGPEYVDGHLCSACAAVYLQVGALGPTFLERAVLEAQRLTWQEVYRIPGLRAWVATGRPPGEPWAWVEVAEPEPDLEPLAALQLQVADLAAEVAALRAAS